MRNIERALFLPAALIAAAMLSGCYRAPSGDSPGKSPPPPETSAEAPDNEDIRQGAPPLAAPGRASPQISGGSTSGDTTAEDPSAVRDSPEDDFKNSKRTYSGLEKGEVLANYQTPIKDFAKNRMNNLRLVAKKLNGTVIKAGDEFSFNESVGPRTMKRGFRKAIIFKNDQKVKEIGGGICQMSTTLYQTALEAGFDITERHEHGLDVPYAKKGDDATVYYGSQDLRFVNTSGTDVRLECKIGKDSVYAGFTVA